jgi:hypothetical protein
MEQFTDDAQLQALIESVMDGSVVDPEAIEKVRAFLAANGYALEPVEPVEPVEDAEMAPVVPPAPAKPSTFKQISRYLADANDDDEVTRGEAKVFGMGVLVGWLASRILR